MDPTQNGAPGVPAPPAPAARGKRILVLIPSGTVYDHDKVKWYETEPEKVQQHYFNVGDMVVYDSTLKILDYRALDRLVVTNPTAAQIERYKSFDYIFLRGSNFIHNRMDWLSAVEVLEKVQLPVYAIGVGSQAPSRDNYQLTGDNLRIWQMISERSKLIGVRGTFTADVLYSNGIKNIEIAGCPSLFRARNRDLRIAPPASLDHVAFSIRRETNAGYSSDVAKYLSVQRDFLVNTLRQFDTTLTTHGEAEEKAFYYRNEPAIAAARKEFLRSGWWTAETAEELEKLYREKMFFFLRVEDYDDFIRTQDFAFGYRVHGVLPALAQGVPGLLVKYDTRSTELADSFAIPSVVLKDQAPADVPTLLREVSFDEFNKVYPVRYDKMKFVLEQNGIPHRM